MTWSDTKPKVMALLVEGYRRMTPEEKLLKVDELNKFLVALIEAEVRKQYPDADEREIRLQVASRWLPPELIRKAFGWDLRERGY